MKLINEIEDVFRGDPTFGALAVCTFQVWFPILIVGWILSLVTGQHG